MFSIKIIFVLYIDVVKLLESPVISCDGTDIKFKRTRQIIDQTSFLLKVSVSDEDEKISLTDLELHIKTLIKDNPIRKILDLSNDSEQSILVLCSKNISNYNVFFS